MKSDFLERNQKPSDKRRTAIIEMFVKKSGKKLEDTIALAEDLNEAGASFERSLADALEAFKLDQ